MLELQARTEEDLPKLAELILQRFDEQHVFAFKGDLGAGKTTLIKQMCKVLGVNENMSSPTFGIINEYLSTAGDPVYHFDMYRLEDPEEAMGIGFEDYLSSGYYCFIEWPEIVEKLLPEEYVEILIVDREGTRNISITKQL